MSADRAAGPKHILVLDDDQPTCRLIQLTLESEGHVVTVCATAEEVFSAAEMAPHLLILDYLLPGLEPEGFLKELRSRGFGMPVVLCTGYDFVPALDVVRTLKKPFTPEDLASLVAELA